VSAVSSAAGELAREVRGLIDEMMTVESSPQALRAAAAGVQSVRETLRAGGGVRRGPLTSAPDGDAANFFAFSPVSGSSNPVAPPMRVSVTGQTVIATCNFGKAYEGPPGYVHGAWVAAVFDELLGIVNAVSGNPAMTGLLEVRYLLPTPLGKELRIVGRQTGQSGRKSFATGEILDGDAVTAEAKGTFVAVTTTRAAELFGQQMGETNSGAAAPAGAVSDGAPRATAASSHQ
jgi:acyl-coenzyme A thioesterase PaaI-like protein